ncbi:MAG: response regulator transcription factor [Rhodococcus sp. (in: high G+C Gram-positive bacteria)]|uniref:response regulator transcription factor n=1 Tax=Rhodococcus sp. TaxID=1831 RepID=UPI002ADB43A5|nr:response regulator transcription factor [Rhodococcus sp. (in: high G+C Gram-positive bacteria)]
MTITVLLAEDVALLAEAFEVLLSTDPDIEVVGRVSRGDEVGEAVARLRPDVVLMDIDMPGMTGIQATAALRATDDRTPVLLLTALPGSGHVHDALAAGANGYLLKSTDAEHLFAGIKSVLSKHTVIDPALAAEALRAGPNPLRDRELDVLRLVDEGLSTKQIGERLFLSPGTVRNYLSSIISKLGASTRLEAIKTARGNGWL